MSGHPEQHTTCPNVIICEGNDDEHFLSKLLEVLNLRDRADIRQACGKDQITPSFIANIIQNAQNPIRNLLVICDADNSFEQSFQSVQGSVKFALTKTRPTESIRSHIFIFPNHQDKGELEDLFLEAAEEKDRIQCVSNYFDCLTKSQKPLLVKLSKAKATAYLAGVEPLDDKGRSLKGIRGVGLAAQCDGIWNLSHPSLDPLKTFLRSALSEESIP